MATNVSEKDRILRLLDAELNDIDRREFDRLYWQLVNSPMVTQLHGVKRKPGAGFEIGHYSSDAGYILKRTEATTIGLRGDEKRDVRVCVIVGPEDAFDIIYPSKDEEAAAWCYVGYRRALAKIHQWIVANLGYSGDMPSEVPNQSEGADA